MVLTDVMLVPRGYAKIERVTLNQPVTPCSIVRSELHQLKYITGTKTAQQWS
jgi:hypothetical protein